LIKALFLETNPIPVKTAMGLLGMCDPELRLPMCGLSEENTEKLKKACPQGVDVYFDNVGGDITDQAMKLINDFARIAICGQISMYNLDKPDLGPRNWWHLLIKRATARGFIVSDYAERFSEGAKQMGQWIKEGKIKYSETVAEGLENAPKAFLGLFKGENIGKQLVKV